MCVRLKGVDAEKLRVHLLARREHDGEGPLTTCLVE
jgi:hypothetical protein